MIDIITAISLGSAMLAVIALLLTWQYHPKPYLEFDWQTEGNESSVDGVLERGLTVTNVGNAPASGFSLIVDLVKDLPDRKWTSVRNLTPGESVKVLVPQFRVLKVKQASGYSYETVDEAERPRAPKVTVTWRQSPFFWRKRSKSSMPNDRGLYKLR